MRPAVPAVHAQAGGLGDHDHLGPEDALAEDVLPAQAVAVLLHDGAGHPQLHAVEEAELLRDPRAVHGRRDAGLLVGGAAAVDDRRRAARPGRGRASTWRGRRRRRCRGGRRWRRRPGRSRRGRGRCRGRRSSPRRSPTRRISSARAPTTARSSALSEGIAIMSRRNADHVAGCRRVAHAATRRCRGCRLLMHTTVPGAGPPKLLRQVNRQRQPGTGRAAEERALGSRKPVLM